MYQDVHLSLPSPTQSIFQHATSPSDDSVRFAISLIVNHQNELFIFIVGTEFPLKCYQPNVKVRVFGSICLSMRSLATSFAGLNLFILHLDTTIFHWKIHPTLKYVCLLATKGESLTSIRVNGVGSRNQRNIRRNEYCVLFVLVSTLTWFKFSTLYEVLTNGSTAFDLLREHFVCFPITTRLNWITLLFHKYQCAACF